MPRRLSPTTIGILKQLWMMPWASATELHAILAASAPLAPSTVSNALARCKRRGWLLSVSLGRERDTVNRRIISNAGLDWGGEMGWRREWWHSATGYRALAGRIQVVEVVHETMLNLFRSNLVRDNSIEVFESYPDVVERTGEPITGWQLAKAYWVGAQVCSFAWQEKGPLDAVVGYYAVAGAGAYGTVRSADILPIPVRLFNRFHRQRDVANIRRQMKKILRERDEKSSLSMDQALHGDFYPGVVGVCTDGAAAALVNCHYLGTSGLKSDHVALGIMDLQDHAVRPMSRPTNWWTRPEQAARPRAVGNLARMVELLQRGPYAAVNGRRSWRVFRTVAIRPGSTLRQIAALNGLEAPEARPLLRVMVEKGAILIWRGGYYLNERGRRLFADSERVTSARVLKQQGEYARPDGRFRRKQRLHNWGTTETVLALHLQGFPVFSALGMNVDYYVNVRRYRVSPDAWVLLPPGVLVAIEYERSARGPKAVAKKALRYQLLADIGRPIPVLFVTETEEAASLFADLRLPQVLSATLDRLKQGPQGKAVLDGQGRVGGEPGCWTYWYSNHGGPVHDAPIDLWPTLRPRDYRPWRIGARRPYSSYTLAELLAAHDV